MKKPFLKWPGGKYRLLDRILGCLPAGRRLVEPFAGSGAVSMNASHSRLLICDSNPDVIGCMQALREGGEDFIRHSAGYFTPEANTSETYYRLREEFNSMHRDDEPGPDTAQKAACSAARQARAALFIYLNRHGYNGVIRYNRRFQFNVPFGRYARPRFPEKEMRAFLEKLNTAETTLRVCDFRESFAQLKKGDVVYCDPPYMPLSETAKFTAYSGRSFGRAEQEQLVKMARAAAARGIPVLISNHDTEQTRALYAAAREIHSFDVWRSISCKGEKRLKVAELIAVFS